MAATAFIVMREQQRRVDTERRRAMEAEKLRRLQTMTMFDTVNYELDAQEMQEDDMLDSMRYVSTKRNDNFMEAFKEDTSGCRPKRGHTLRTDSDRAKGSLYDSTVDGATHRSPWMKPFLPQLGLGRHRSDSGSESADSGEWTAASREKLDLKQDQLRFGLKEKRKTLIIDPEWHTRVLWDFFVVLFVAFNAIEIPLRVGMDVNVSKAYLNVTTNLFDVFFFMDIMVNFFTTYTGKDGNLVNDYRMIAQRYLRTWFWTDLISALPFDSVWHWFSPGASKLKVLGPLEMLRLLRLAKIVKILRRYTKRVGYGYRILLSLTWFVTWAHIIGCTFHWLGLFQLEDSDGNQSWLTAHGIYGSGLKKKFAYSFYWSMTTMTTVGYGDIAATTDTERIFLAFMMLCSALGYASIFGSVSLSLSQLSADYSNYRSRVDNLEKYLCDLGLPSHFRHRVHEYMDYIWEKNHGLTDQLSDLPDRVKREANTLAHYEMLGKSSLFLFLPQSTISQITTNLRLTVALPKEPITTRGSLADKIYFIKRGQVRMISETGRTVCYLEEGGYFGEIPILFKQHKKWPAAIHKRGARALGHCDFYVLSRKNLLQLLKTYPVLRRLMWHIAKRRQKKDEFYYDDALVDRSVLQALHNPQNADYFVKPHSLTGTTNIDTKELSLDDDLHKGEAGHKPQASTFLDAAADAVHDIIQEVEDKDKDKEAKTGSLVEMQPMFLPAAVTVADKTKSDSSRSPSEVPSIQSLEGAVASADEEGEASETPLVYSSTAEMDKVKSESTEPMPGTGTVVSSMMDASTSKTVSGDSKSEDEDSPFVCVDAAGDDLTTAVADDVLLPEEKEAKTRRDSSCWQKFEARMDEVFCCGRKKSGSAFRKMCSSTALCMFLTDTDEDADALNSILTSVSALKTKFDAMADPSTGSIFPEVFFDTFEGVGYLTRLELQHCWDEIDTDGSGDIDVNEFIELCTNVALLHPGVNSQELLIRSLHFVLEEMAADSDDEEEGVGSDAQSQTEEETKEAGATPLFRGRTLSTKSSLRQAQTVDGVVLGSGLRQLRVISDEEMETSVSKGSSNTDSSQSSTDIEDDDDGGDEECGFSVPSHIVSAATEQPVLESIIMAQNSQSEMILLQLSLLRASVKRLEQIVMKQQSDTTSAATAAATAGRSAPAVSSSATGIGTAKSSRTAKRHSAKQSEETATMDTILESSLSPKTRRS